MKITIESTEQITHLDGVRVRVWKGKTEGGVECHVFVHRLAVERTADTEQFDRELAETMQPGRFFSLRDVL